MRNQVLREIFQVHVPQLHLSLHELELEQTLEYILQNTSSLTEKELHLRKLQNFIRPRGTTLKNAITSAVLLYKKYHGLEDKIHFGPKLEHNAANFNQSLYSFVVNAIRQLVAPELLSNFEHFMKGAQYSNAILDLQEVLYLLDKDEEMMGCQPMKLNLDSVVMINHTKSQSLTSNDLSGNHIMINNITSQSTPLSNDSGPSNHVMNISQSLTPISNSPGPSNHFISSNRPIKSKAEKL